MFPSSRSATGMYRTVTIAMLALILGFAANPIAAQQNSGPGETTEHQASYDLAPIVIDGRQLFLLRGIPSFPAKERVATVRKRIIAAADDPTLEISDITLTELGDRSSINAGPVSLLSVFDADAEVEGIDRQTLAGIYQQHIITAINHYREDRSTPVLARKSGFALAATAILAGLLWVVLRLTRRLEKWAARHVQKNIRDLEYKSHQLIHAGQLWTLAAGLMRGIRILFILLIIYTYLNSVLGLFPWTRPAAMMLFDLILNPLESIWRGFLASIPDLSFLVILFFVVRYILKLTRLFFDGVQSGRIRLQNFDRDWALPTYKILRLLIIAFGIVVAYPYIPGSDSMAFKGVSLFLGVIVSLGSSSFIANMMAGLSMTYRGAFKEGERVKIGDVEGHVEDIKLMVTRLRTHKNEIVVVPNSNILNTNVVNYSHLAKKQGIVMHTVVGIGYDVPWRQVEAMLLEAAARTRHIKTNPSPFVLQLSLGDFAVNYELNVYCDDETRMPAIYSELHAHVQDVFNEYGVQIMSPAYESDPASAKVVPQEQWYAAPAKKPEPSSEQ